MSLIKQEWNALLKNKKVLIAVIGVLFIPLMYSGGYLSAFWDPYGKLDQLPVAVVNNDTGTIYEGEELDVGDELVENLEESAKFEWRFVDKEEAEKGLKNHDYYMTIEIPENFSSNATTLQDEQPQHLELSFKTNKGYNFISGQIGESAIAKIKEEVATSITKTYAETIFDNIELMADGIGEASDGADKINEGVGELKEGSSTLDESLHELVTKSVTFKEGLQEASNGSSKLANGVSSLDNGLSVMKQGQDELYKGSVKAESGTSQLVTGLNDSLSGMKELQVALPNLTNGTEILKSSAPKLAEGTKQLADGSNSASVGAAALSQNLSLVTNEVNNMLKELQTMPLPEEKKQELVKLVESLNALDQGGKELSANLSELSAGADDLNKNVAQLPTSTAKLYEGTASVQDAINQLTEGQEKLYNGAVQVNEGQSQITDGLSVLSDKIAKAKDGTTQLKNGGVALENGISQLADGSVALEDGSMKLADGADQIDKGLTELSDGTSELSTKLGEASEDTKDAKGSNELYDMVADPVKLNTEELTEVPNYGTGLAPYFLSLALFVGSLLLTVVFPLRKSSGVPKSGFSWFISKFSILFIVAVIQALLADLILLYGLGIEVKSDGLFILFSMLTSLTFISIVQLLVTTMADPGRFIAIIVLILQLTTSAGTFPLELLPNVFQKINHWLPMTYSVAGFKAIISSGDFGYMWSQALVLVRFLMCTMIGTIIYFTLKLKKESYTKALITEEAR
ncbi:YhgE/Pip domain-containing protein [Metabacillus bambusae]|uniref:YhgE/Pip domain-containing protein n=1 Tax=Metabacillus bambusae TaxID=2795218 RepID=A0ABS3N429_9BACI|nr:YhgE/Pip domain-containing protein [Metabacillus bambusae]MBO1512938.1 YhgE/Pip domain-containing protein [Metabacillus bambusae]